MDNKIPQFIPRKSPLLHWFEHPVDLSQWQQVAGKPRGPARAVVYKGKSYPSLRAAAKANGP